MLREPQLSRFRQLILEGACVQDIHDAHVFAGYATAFADVSDAYLDREVRRVESHQANLIPLLERFVGRVSSIADVGCGTGGTTLALALSEGLSANKIVGFDPNPRALTAARVRAEGYALPAVRFKACRPNDALPADEHEFDLTVSVSVFEFISTPRGREFFAAELIRVTRPGGFILLVTPTPLSFRELHSRRVLGDFRRRAGYPWSTLPGTVRRMFSECRPVSLNAYLCGKLAHRFRLPPAIFVPLLALGFGKILPWQRFLFQKHAAT